MSEVAPLARTACAAGSGLEYGPPHVSVRLAHSQVGKFAEASAQSVADLPQALCLGQLAEQHRDQLRPRGEALAVAVRAALADVTDEFPPRNQRKHLTEQVGGVFHIGGLLSG
jgi:hypothetical protein